MYPRSHSPAKRVMTGPAMGAEQPGKRSMHPSKTNKPHTQRQPLFSQMGSNHINVRACSSLCTVFLPDLVQTQHVMIKLTFEHNRRSIVVKSRSSVALASWSWTLFRRFGKRPPTPAFKFKVAVVNDCAIICKSRAAFTMSWTVSSDRSDVPASDRPPCERNLLATLSRLLVHVETPAVSDQSRIIVSRWLVANLCFAFDPAKQTCENAKA